MDGRPKLEMSRKYSRNWKARSEARMEVKENGDMEPDQVEPIVMQRGDERSFDHHGHHDRLFRHAEFI